MKLGLKPRDYFASSHGLKTVATQDEPEVAQTFRRALPDLSVFNV